VTALVEKIHNKIKSTLNSVNAATLSSEFYLSTPCLKM